MKTTIAKLGMIVMVFGGVSYYSNYEHSNELSDIVLENLKVVNTASAEESVGETGPIEFSVCGGWAYGHRSAAICRGFNEYSCTSTPCSSLY